MASFMRAFLRKRGLQICAEYGIQLPMQTSFIDWPQEPRFVSSLDFGDKRAAWLNPLRTMWDKGIVMSAGSDAPCTDPDPILWMQRACNHDNPEQSLTIKEALRMCTYNGAWTTFDEDERGSLEVGKVADKCSLKKPLSAVVRLERSKGRGTYSWREGLRKTASERSCGCVARDAERGKDLSYALCAKERNAKMGFLFGRCDTL